MNGYGSGLYGAGVYGTSSSSPAPPASGPDLGYGSGGFGDGPYGGVSPTPPAAPSRPAKSLNPFHMSVYSKDFRWLQFIGDPLYATFTPRWTLGTGEFRLRATDPANEWLQQDGARITVWYRGEHLMSGWVASDDGDVPPGGTVTYQVTDDWTALPDTLAWVNPAGSLTPTSLTDPAQGVDGGYYRFTSTVAETAIKQLITANCVSRLRLPITIVPDQGRGGTVVLPQARFGPLSDPIGDIQAQSGLGVRIWHAPGSSHLSMDVFQPTVWRQTFTYESGVLSDGTYSSKGPAATRVVVGGPGEDVQRAFWQVADTDLEARFGRVVEVFRDATGATLTWPSTVPSTAQVPAYYLLDQSVAAADKAAFRSYLAAASAQALADGLPTSGLAMTLSETESFHFHGVGGLHIGDTITVTAGRQTFQEQLTECTVAWSPDGLTVTPVIGKQTDDPSRLLAESISKLAAARRRDAAGR